MCNKAAGSAEWNSENCLREEKRDSFITENP